MSMCRKKNGQLKKGFRLLRGGGCAPAKGKRKSAKGKKGKRWAYVDGKNFDYGFGGPKKSMCFRESKKTGKKKLVPQRMCARHELKGFWGRLTN